MAFDKKNHAILPWMGGKSRLAAHLAKVIQSRPHTSYVEVFAGAAHVLFYKPESKSETLNDINGELVNLYRVVQHHLEEFLRHFKWALVAREEFDRLRSANPGSLTDIQRASRFFYLQKMAFGGKIGGTYGTSTVCPPRFNLLRLEEDLSQAHLRLSRVNIEHLDWRECLKRYDRPHSLFYLDPPYLGGEDDYGKGLFERQDYSELSETLADIQGDFILSLNDRPEIRALFGWCDLEPVELNYRVSKGKSTEARELIITPKSKKPPVRSLPKAQNPVNR